MNPIAKKFQNILKLLFDYLVTILCLLLLLPVIVTLAIVLKISGEGPVIYSQERIGRNGKTFVLYKFRSMFLSKDEGIPLLSGHEDKRITEIGRFMRKHKFDEIPNFINVLKGEMSLVGPRPEQKYYREKIIERDPRYKLLQVIKPGITSWGQVKFGYATNVEEMIERMEFDLFYLNNKSFGFDMKIALCTLGIIFKGKGI